ncbi:hypothetical protein D3C83_181950 [compost metagenome]
MGFAAIAAAKRSGTSSRAKKIGVRKNHSVRSWVATIARSRTNTLSAALSQASPSANPNSSR